MSFLSDTDSDSNSESAAAVNELLSQAKDLCILEQISAINCSSFSDDSVLASDLESRFARLKSFPTTTPKPKPIPPPNPSSNPQTHTPSKPLASHSATPSLPSSPAAPSVTKRVDSKIGSPAAVRAKRFDDRSEESPSMGCSFWCSPKKGFSSSASTGRKKKIKEVDWTRKSDFGWSKNEELLEDLGSFSIEEQRKILKKAMVEQKKISNEARKIVKMAKKGSIGKSVNNGTEEDLSD